MKDHGWIYQEKYGLHTPTVAHRPETVVVCDNDGLYAAVMLAEYTDGWYASHEYRGKGFRYSWGTYPSRGGNKEPMSKCDAFAFHLLEIIRSFKSEIPTIGVDARAIWCAAQLMHGQIYRFQDPNEPKKEYELRPQPKFLRNLTDSELLKIINSKEEIEPIVKTVASVSPVKFVQGSLF